MSIPAVTELMRQTSDTLGSLKPNPVKLPQAPDQSPERSMIDPLVRMKGIVGAREPNLTPLLEPKTGVSVAEIIQTTVDQAVSPDLKAELLGVEVGWHVDSGRPGDGVMALSRAKAGSLPLEGYDQARLTSIFERTFSTDISQAWKIAKTMLNDGAKVLKPPEVKPENYGVWMVLERRAFEAYAQEVLSRQKPDDQGKMIAYAQELGDLFNSAKSRSDGFDSGQSSEIVKSIGTRMVDVDLALGESGMAIQDAADAGMSLATLSSLRNRSTPGLISNIRARFSRGS